MVNRRRTAQIKRGVEKAGPVVYWMNRDQRSQDNWALLFAQEMALVRKAPLAVVFCLASRFLGATVRQYDFMLSGLEEVEADLAEKRIAFRLLMGSPEREIPGFLRDCGASVLVTDFFPLRIKDGWIKAVADRIDIPFFEVDAHNIVPCWAASPKQEFGAYTLRPKIHRALPELLDTFPRLKVHPVKWEADVSATDWTAARRSLEVDKTVRAVDWLRPGPRAGRRTLRRFILDTLAGYDDRRNDPTMDGRSNLSPYLHFGQIAPQRVAIEVGKARVNTIAKDAFLEEMIVRRELSDNFCHYNPSYDSFAGLPAWAKKTLDQHRRDKREYVYSLKQFEEARTHDPLWNAAQMEMVHRGKMHGYMRMYWGKKILEWTESPEDAMRIAIHLNDKYELDGRDPNGYVGVAWSIGGVHDRPWRERDVFGKVRYMNYNGCKRKFDVDAYIAKVKELSG
ncbi:MAG: deoxyribodipyrimidine photo-lyase [Planctomycetota bacterium]